MPENVRWTPDQRDAIEARGGSLLVSAAAGSAAVATDYTVKSVTGKVTYLEKSGSWKPLANGIRISDSTQVNVGLNSKLTISDGSEQITIGQMKRGTVGKLTGKGSTEEPHASAPSRDVADEAKGNRHAVQTAASRASNEADDDDWEDDDWEDDDN